MYQNYDFAFNKGVKLKMKGNFLKKAILMLRVEALFYIQYSFLYSFDKIRIQS